VREFGIFAVRQAQCAQFALFVFAAAAVAPFVPIGRYDFLLIACLGYQAYLVASHQETGRELLALCGFHLVGLALEIYKVRHGSWQYPWPSETVVADVPLFSGFMYAAVASYMLQAWKRFSLRFTGWPPLGWVVLVGLAIYANFFFNRFLPDIRWIIAGLGLLVFWRTRVEFRVDREWSMSFALAMTLIGFFVYLAENLCTYLAIYVYPHQSEAWSFVGLGKLSSWILLSTVSVLILAAAKRTTVFRQPAMPGAARLGPLQPLVATE
jgi:uncharacterized membrane protein YoaT (DUF817 family)